METNYLENYRNNSNDIYIGSEVTSESALKNTIEFEARLKKFDDEGIPYSDRVITYHIVDCHGGSVSAGLATYDEMMSGRAKIRVICSGMVASMGVVLALGGTKGMREAYPNTEFLIHQPLGGAQGQASDILIQARHIEKTRERLYKIMAERTGQSVKKIASDSDRDFILTAEEALSYGIIDKIIGKEET